MDIFFRKQSLVQAMHRLGRVFCMFVMIASFLACSKGKSPLGGNGILGDLPGTLYTMAEAVQGAWMDKDSEDKLEARIDKALESSVSVAQLKDIYNDLNEKEIEIENRGDGKVGNGILKMGVVPEKVTDSDNIKLRMHVPVEAGKGYYFSYLDEDDNPVLYEKKHAYSDTLQLEFGETPYAEFSMKPVIIKAILMDKVRKVVAVRQDEYEKAKESVKQQAQKLSNEIDEKAKKGENK